jgi:hypothetical protein
MAYDTIRQFLGQALQQRLLQQSPAYQQQLVEGELKNRMLAMEMDEMFPLKVQALTKELDYMIDPYRKIEAQQAAQYDREQALEKLRAMNREAEIRLRGETDIRTKAQPSYVYNYGRGSAEDTTAIKTAQSNLRLLQSRLKSIKQKKEGWNPLTKSWEVGYEVAKENAPLYNDLVEQIRLQSELAGTPVEADEFIPIQGNTGTVTPMVIPADGTTTVATTKTEAPATTSWFKR